MWFRALNRNGAPTAVSYVDVQYVHTYILSRVIKKSPLANPLIFFVRQHTVEWCVSNEMKNEYVSDNILISIDL